MRVHITVIGAGLMGRGIAQVLIQNELQTTLLDVDESILNTAHSEIVQRLSRMEEKAQITDIEMNSYLENLVLSTNFDSAVKQSRIVIEAIPENLDLKRAIFEKIRNINSRCIIASNTSSLSINELSQNMPENDKIIGMHWFNPPPLMKLIEVVHCDFTSQETIDATLDLAIQLGKDPILVRDFPGFASSRLGVSLGLEAIRMVEQNVASIEDIDKAMQLGYRHPMGPLELTDYIGLDTRLNIAKYLNEEEISPAFKIPELLVTMVKDGKLGRKSGQGFYKWNDGKKVQV